MPHSDPENAIQSIDLPDSCMVCEESIATTEELGGTENVLGFHMPVCIRCTDKDGAGVANHGIG